MRYPNRLLPLLFIALPALAPAQEISTTTLEPNELWRCGADDDLEEIKPSNIACFDLVAVE